MLGFASQCSEDCSIGPGTARSYCGTTIDSGIKIRMHDLGAQRQELQSYGGNAASIVEEDPKV